MEKQMEKLIKKIRIQTTIEVITGMHIGGSGDSVEIGGIDLPVIKLALKKNQPYIPGSSMKGKIRCLLEQTRGATEVGMNKEVNNLFGMIKKKNNDRQQPSKLIVRDAMLTADSLKELLACDSLDMPYTENKWENTIKRVDGTAENPRQIERVPAGAEFNAEFIINVWDVDKEGKDLLDLLEEGIRLLENDYLGGNGSRGYGQVRFKRPFKITEVSGDNDWKEKQEA